jgi:hypothetical protein
MSAMLDRYQLGQGEQGRAGETGFGGSRAGVRRVA